jgi:hypothetical protein
MVRLTQTEHLSCTDDNTVSKQIKTRFRKIDLTKQFHRMPPILFLSLRYVQRKPCTNLALRVALSRNGPNKASTRASSPRGPIECVQNDFYAYVCSVQTMHLCCTNTNTISKRTKTRFHMTTLLTSSIGCVQNYL